MVEEEKVTMTKAELEAWYTDKRKDETMTKDERRVRGLIREELKAALGEIFESAGGGDDDAGDDAGEKDNAVGGDGDTLMGAFSKFLGIGA